MSKKNYNLLEETKKACWDKGNVLTRLEGFGQDFYRDEERKEFIERLNFMVEQIWKNKQMGV